jgi:MoxR-like ATPase
MNVLKEIEISAAAPTGAATSAVFNRAASGEDEYSRTIEILRAVPPPPGYVNVSGVMLPCRDAPATARSAEFVSTTATTAALHAAALASAQAAPLLLCGPSGSGKTSLASELAHTTGNSDMLSLFCDDLMDARALLGAYVCSSTPGEFFWQPGPLAAAAAAGRWVLFDGLHLAPVEVVALVDAFVTAGVLHVPQRGDAIVPHADFRILATAQTVAAGALPLNNMAGDWWRIELPAPTLADRCAVLSGRFPAAAQLLLLVMALVEIVRESQHAEAASEVDSASEVDAVWLKWRAAAHACMRECGLVSGKGMIALGRDIGMHDHVKLLQRLTAFHRAALEAGMSQLPRMTDGSKVQDTATVRAQCHPKDVLKLSVELRQAILLEASEVFCGFASSEVRNLLELSLAACCTALLSRSTLVNNRSMRSILMRYWSHVGFKEVRLLSTVLF